MKERRPVRRAVSVLLASFLAFGAFAGAHPALALTSGELTARRVVNADGQITEMSFTDASGQVVVAEDAG